MALKALTKELNIEKLLEKEELEKERKENEELDRKIDLEKIKDESITKAIKERELENQLNQKAKSRAEEFNNLREVAKKQIIYRREYLKKRLENIRKRAEKKKLIKQQQIRSLRLETASKISNAYRKGSVETCLKAISSSDQWDSYCIGFFRSNYLELDYCKKENDKCHFCCDKEFGDLYVEEKGVCVKKVCSSINSKDFINGNWILNGN